MNPAGGGAALRWVVVVAATLAACTSTEAPLRDEAASATSTSPTTTAPSSPVITAPSTSVVSTTTPRPSWLGTRVLPEGAGGFGEVQPTPPELADRRFATIDVLPPPASAEWAPSVSPVSDAVAGRSTWTVDCPVPLADLRHLTVPFVGFDRERHTGELLVHADAVDAVLEGFRVLFERGFPIEEMRIVRVDELDAPPTGDGNNTTAFVCRPTRGSSSWSEHAYGRAVDINPFHNPYVKGDLVLPELASAYSDRADLRPGMLTADDVAGFESAGWGWGGHWRSLQDHMHVSASGR